ncbi:MAG: anhydro-N-acetylmuramic acid kinase, partial [Pseudomonadota bacterium]|nr:anhydro-N-acetylmuramic acid kinase [Pseudomonadota bacterium]
MAELYIGVMSGTSLDGIDVVAVSFAPLQLHAQLSVPFPAALHQTLLALTQSGSDEIERLGRAEVAYAEVVASAITQMIETFALPRDAIVAVGSHGQTIRHRPEAGFSVQIGDPNLIAERTGLTVVADFRRRDLAAGGQGAPLVPAFHQAIFQHPTIDRVVLNLGGIANISVLPAGQPDAVYGFDTGPANLLLDAWCQRHTGQPFDQDGAWAAQGVCDQDLLAQLLRHPYFEQ